MKADKQSRLTPKLRFPEFREEPGWEVKELSNLLTSISNGCSLPQNNSTSGLKFTRIETIADGTIDLLRVGYIDKNEEEVKQYRLNIGDLLFSNINSVAHIGKSVLIEEDYNLYHGMNLLRLQVNQEANSPQFIYFSINSPRVRESLRAKANKAVNQASINQTALGETLIPSPSRNEQQKIADCLGSLDDLIAAEGEKLGALRRHKQGLMQQLFPQPGETVPRLRFPEFRAQGAWELTNLSKLGKIQSGSTPSKANPAFWSGSIPWVSAKDMKRLFLDNTQDHISSAAVNDGARLVPAGTILILTRGMTLLNVVPICVLRREMSFNQDVKALRPNVNVHGLFLAFLLLANEHRLLKMVDIAGHGTGKLNTDELEAFELALPQLAEQQRIADSLSSLDDRIVAQARRIEALKTHKQGLLQQLFPSPEEESR